jgi:exoribonuclease-2
MSAPYALYEEAGRFHAGRVLSETDSSAQVELASGKRAKVKAAHILLRFAEPDPAALLADAEARAPEVDLDLAWESAPEEEEFDFATLAREYWGDRAGAREEAATLVALWSAPHYFRRLGRGRFRKASAEVVRAALVGIEKKRLATVQVERWAAELAGGSCPADIREQLYRILFKPDKNALETRAVLAAARSTGRAPLELLRTAGAIDSPYQFHWRRFLLEHFPKGVAFAAVDPASLAVAGMAELPSGPARAFSIDDSQTTEIDDALSVTGLGTGTVTVGVHIAAPALGIAPGSAVDAMARQRLSTVYIPGHKLTMLPADAVGRFSLDAGAERPVVSLHVVVDEATLAIRSSETRLERLALAANLRHDAIDDGTAGVAGATPRWPPELGFAAELDFLHRFALDLKAGRERVRGKPENFNRPDHAFRLDLEDGAEIRGDERVEIVERRRGSPLDLIVAEAMILANATWGAWLAECRVPGIYRSQASMAPGVKVRMGTKPAPHAGLGVAHYAWSTSPLRRYVDLVNQWQLVACARHGRSAASPRPSATRTRGCSPSSPTSRRRTPSTRASRPRSSAIGRCAVSPRMACRRSRPM